MVTEDFERRLEGCDSEGKAKFIEVREKDGVSDRAVRANLG